MAKVKKITRQRTTDVMEKEELNIENKLSTTAKVIISHAVIFLLVVIFFAPLFFGDKTVVSGDIFNIQSYVNFFEKGGHLLWDPYIFLGMPIFGNVEWFDFFFHGFEMFRAAVSGLFSSWYNGWTIYLLPFGFFYYYLMRYLKAPFIVALTVSLAAVFSTGILLLFFIGHITKLLSLIVFPLIILFLLRFNEKIRLIDVLLFLLTFHFLLRQWHIQIIFYMFFTIGIYYLYFFVRSLYLKDKLHLTSIAKSLAAFIIITVIAFGMNYYKLKQIYDYSQYSTRGTKSITDIQNQETEKKNEEFYQYATNWSFSPGEVMTFLIPSFYGYGNSVYKGPLTNNQEVEVNTYFGQMPFVDVAQYFGAIIFCLGLFAIFTRWREPLVQFLTFLIVICLLLSFGRTFPLLYDFFFYYVPFFDKFRAPSMILNIIQLSFPILAGLGLMKIISYKEEKSVSGIKILKNTAIAVSALFVISVLLSGALSSWFTQRIVEAGQKAEQLKPLYDYMSSMFIGDILINIGLLAIVFWGAFAFIKGKLTYNVFALAVLIIIVADLWRIDYRGAKFVDASVVNERFAMPDYIKTIKAQNNPEPYRLFNLKQDATPGSFRQNNNFHVYFLEEDFYGYSGIKPRTYQDIIDVIGPVNPTLWNMLNVKYIVTEQRVAMPGMKEIYAAEKSFVYENETALPRVFFVDSVVQAEPVEILQHIKNNSFDPEKIAYSEEAIQGIKPAEGSVVKITGYSDEMISLDVDAEGNNLLFMGSTYYPLGWKVIIDGNEGEIIKLNYGFMGVVVPKGQHKVEFVFEPGTFYKGRYLTLTFNIIIFAGLLFHLYRMKISKK